MVLVSTKALSGDLLDEISTGLTGQEPTIHLHTRLTGHLVDLQSGAEDGGIGGVVEHGVEGAGEGGVGEDVVEDVSAERLLEQTLEHQRVRHLLVLRERAHEALDDRGDVVGQALCGEQPGGPADGGDGVVAVGQRAMSRGAACGDGQPADALLGDLHGVEVLSSHV